jgi:hypothetical protein
MAAFNMNHAAYDMAPVRSGFQLLPWEMFLEVFKDTSNADLVQMRLISTQFNDWCPVILRDRAVKWVAKLWNRAEHLWKCEQPADGSPEADFDRWSDNYLYLLSLHNSLARALGEFYHKTSQPDGLFLYGQVSGFQVIGCKSLN